jgi:broad specificity phosphatase PhoE
VLEADPGFAGFNFDPLTPDWTSKQGFWAPQSDAILNRARWVRQWLRSRPEKNIVLVAHGDILRNIMAGPNGPSNHPWKNAEVRIFRFHEKYVDTDDCFLDEEQGVAAAGGYAPTSTEIDLIHTKVLEGNL